MSAQPTSNEAHAAQTLALAAKALALSQPNPRVGCVIAASAGQTASGHTQRAGGPHAEVMALRDAAARGLDVRGATAWVTLEPCSHHGRTPPCCDALTAAGIARVMVAIEDPNPQVAGRGIERLRAAGIDVQVVGGDWGQASRELNIGFFSRMVRGLPWVRMKVAASLDGRTALNDGRSQWITGEPARADGHAWRARACAVLTGIGTVLEDDPLLDVRAVDTPRQPTLVVVDSRLQTPLTARLWQRPTDPSAEGGRAVWIAHAARNPAAEAALQARGSQLIHLPGTGDKVDLPALMRELARRGINELHVEAGHKLNGSLLRASCVDELLLYMAPKLIGPGRELAALPDLAAVGADDTPGATSGLDGALALEFKSFEPVGSDLRIVARLAGRDQF